MKAESAESQGRTPPASPQRPHASGFAGAWSEPGNRNLGDVSVGEVASSMLRAARGSGVFLHELLERLPLASFAEAGDFDAWRARADVDALVSEAMAAHRVAPLQRAHSERLLWAAYTTPIDLPGGERLGCLSAAPRVVREMRYVFSVGDGRRAAAYVRGSLDLVFEHRGLAYFVDWKSDSLPAYGIESLGAHVAEHYRQQLELYALAVVKLLGVGSEADYGARFGGVIYCFLRGMGSAGGGLWSTRPSFSDILAWSESLRAARALTRKGSSS
jgi:exodeoxyribonuclease V beta subunit